MPSDVESPMYATELQEEAFRDAASFDFDAPSDCGDFASSGVVFRVEFLRPLASGAGVVSGASTVWCEDTPGSAGALSAAADNPLLFGVWGWITPAKPATSSARTPSARTTTTLLPTNRRRRCRLLRAPLRHSPDLSCPESRSMAPRRIGSSTNSQESAATPMVAATWSICSERVGFCCRPGAVSTMIGQCQR